MRFDNYADIGSSTTPKYGLVFKPIDMLSFRGTYQTGFRAPGAGERGHSGVEYFEGEGVDPLRCPITGLPDDCGSGQIAGVNGANPNLKPEKSRAVTVGIVFQPLRQTSLAVDWWQIKRTNEIIGGVGTPVIIRGPVQAAYPTAPGPILEELAPYENVGSDEPKGIDFDLNTVFNFGAIGHLDVVASYSHLISQVYCGFASGAPGACADVVGTHGPTSISGNTGTPANRANVTVSWGQPTWEGGITMNYVSGMTDTDPITSLDNGEALNTCLQSWVPGCYTKAFYDFDLFGHYDIWKGLQVNLHILNVFNQQAPYDYQAAYGQSNYNNAFEQAGAIGRFFEVGFKYKL